MNAAITFDELLRHNEQETERWHRWFSENPTALDVPLDIAHNSDVRGLLVHIFAVELLYTERLIGKVRDKVSPSDFPSGSVDELFGVGRDARAKYGEYLKTWTDAEWQQQVTFRTITAGMQSASRRKAFVHALLHSMRHWAQLATALRQAGFAQEWSHDFLFSSVME